MEFNITTTGINVNLIDLGVELTHPSTVDLYSEGLGSTDIIDSIDLQNALDSNLLIATDQNGNEISDVNLNRISSKLKNIPVTFTWDFLLLNWSSEPTLNTTIASGQVYNYTLGGVTRYRLVPSPYDPSNDSFYSDFDGTNLTNLIISRS